jgi:phosphoribosylaminoimidazole-succinocarboxamide synthase
MVALLESNITGYPKRQGKVRDIYDLGDKLVLIASDRISAFDWVLPTPIPDKGRVLTQLTKFWFDLLKVPNHLLTMNVAEMGAAFAAQFEALAGRTMLVKKTKVVPIECVARGYLIGSGWKEYQQTGAVCGIPLPKGLEQAARLPETIFTPATKAETGHDENISFEQMCQAVGRPLAEKLRGQTLELYDRAAAYARERGIIIADTKFEFGQLPDGQVILIDEVLTPDSSRFWPADDYRTGISPPSFDKQFVRDWLETTNWDKNSPPPELPPEIVAKTRAKYIEAYERLSGKKFL